MAQEDVLGHGEATDGGQLLEEGRDAGCHRRLRRPEWERAAGHADAAPVGRDDPRHDLDQRGLAGAVLAEQGVDLAGSHVQVQVTQDDRVAIRLAQAAHGEHGSVGSDRVADVGRGRVGAVRPRPSHVIRPCFSPAHSGEDEASLLSPAWRRPKEPDRAGSGVIAPGGASVAHTAP